MDQSRSLRAEALEIIQQLGLLDILQPFGEARLVGSVALDLVVKPDIDIHLLLDGKEVKAAAKKITSLLIAEERIQEIRISDYLDKNSLKIGIDSLPGKIADWSIDIWITSDITTTGFEETERFKKELNEENRQKILEYKQYYYLRGQLRHGLSSAIYRAVLEEGITSLEGIQKYYQENDTRLTKGSQSTPQMGLSQSLIKIEDWEEKRPAKGDNHGA